MARGLAHGMHTKSGDSTRSRGGDGFNVEFCGVELDGSRGGIHVFGVKGTQQVRALEKGLMNRAGLMKRGYKREK